MIGTTETTLLRQLGEPMHHPAEDYGFRDIMQWRCGCLAFKTTEGQCNWLPCDRHSHG